VSSTDSSKLWIWLGLRAELCCFYINSKRLRCLDAFYDMSLLPGFDLTIQLTVLTSPRADVMVTPTIVLLMFNQNSVL
jgi:hypothetical protein